MHSQEEDEDDIEFEATTTIRNVAELISSDAPVPENSNEKAYPGKKGAGTP